MSRFDGDQRAELEEKRALVEQLKQKKAETEQHIANLHQSIQAQRAEINAAILYMDQVAKPSLERYQALVAQGATQPTPEPRRGTGALTPPPNPAASEANAELKRLRSQIELYTFTREAMIRFERSIGNATSLVDQTLAMRTAEAEIVLASTRMVLVDYAESRRRILVLLGSGKVGLEERKQLAPLFDRLTKMPLLKQRLSATLQLFQDIETLVSAEDSQVQRLRQMQGRDALKVAQGLKLAQISGKVNQLRNLRASFQSEPQMMNLFPEWTDVQIPRAEAASGERAPTKPFTGRLKELFGFK
jgi:hypothetical protein